jgi:hypothetical protein
MVTSLQTNLAMIELVARRLGRLREEVVFLGGAATALLITDEAAPDVRATMDVDVIVEVTSTLDYHRLAEALRSLGFTEDTGEDAPICRWRIDGIAVDIMPTDEEILGFSSRWYLPALRFASIREVAGEIPIRVVTALYFLATKIEAFHGRGHGDFMASHDVEDIIALIDGRAEIVEEVLHAPEDVRRFIAASLREFIESRDFLESLPGHLLPDPASQQRMPLIMDRIHAIVEV